jgi:hypothetical protein
MKVASPMSRYTPLQCHSILLLIAAGFFVATSVPARAGDGWRTTLLEENDSLYFNSDKHYTQGLRLSALTPVLERGWENDIFDFIGNVPTVFGPGGTRRAALFTGQSIFTPKNVNIKPPDATDRPYAGWLYGGASLLQETDGSTLENLEIQLGVVGPGALGKQAQNNFHQFIDVHQAQGWSKQIQHEVGGVLTYERFWRLPIFIATVVDRGTETGVDFVPQVGGTGGNIFTYGEAGGMLRIGRHLEADYGPVRIRPALSGTDYFNPAALGEEWGYYFFVGAQGRVVARNIFLDGNDFRQSASVTHKTLVADLETGISVFWSSHVRLDVSAVRRTREFVGQRHPDVTGTAALAFTW